MALTANRTYTLRTTRLLSEYLAAYYSSATKIFEYRLGALNPQILATLAPGVKPGAAGITRGYVDALVVLPQEVQLWEAKNKVSDAAIGQLQGYAAEAPASVGWAQYAMKKLTLHLLAAYDDPGAHQRATAAGIEVVIYNPPWYSASQMATEQTAASRVAAASAGKTS